MILLLSYIMYKIFLLRKKECFRYVLDFRFYKSRREEEREGSICGHWTEDKAKLQRTCDGYVATEGHKEITRAFGHLREIAKMGIEDAGGVGVGMRGREWTRWTPKEAGRKTWTWRNVWRIAGHEEPRRRRSWPG